MKCLIMSYGVFDRIGGIDGPTRVESRCDTHGWRFIASETVGADTLCPIGKIEQATEDALAKIRRASRAP